MSVEDVIKKLGKDSVYSSKEINDIIIPLAKDLIKAHKKGKTTIVGIQGGQGTGKTTLVKLLSAGLKLLGYKVHDFSIDDFYKTYKERNAIRKKYPDNPFYAISRGLPGTHRVKYMLSVLKKAKAGKPFEIPIFDKSLHNAAGDVLDKHIHVKTRQDFVLFEGWMVGIPYVSAKTFMRCCEKGNIMVKKLDPTLKHSKVVLKFIKQYEPVWKYFNYFVLMQPKSLQLHKKWRLQAEKEMKKKTGRGMGAKQIDQFVEPFLPFTALCYDTIMADVHILVNSQHKFYKILD
tara:strand:- start:1572 stop:2438 length:867 start_codon:yes stop_codon:yes gene_type:complete